ncbi:MAG: hypothetical protein AABY83_14705 [Pseudomonadota bacterium]
MHIYTGLRCIVAAASWLVIDDVHAAPAISTGIESLRYRQVLYTMYQGDYAQAQIELVAGKERGELSTNAETELLNGVLLYGAGVPEVAMQSLLRVMAQQDVNARYADLAWFHYAKAAKSLGDLQSFQRGLVSIRQSLPGELEQERRFFQVNQLVAEDKFDEAGDVIDSMERRYAWQAYANFNRGVACLNKKLLECGMRAMTAIDELPDTSHETGALRDKARVVLGFWHLQQNEPNRALHFLRSVSLNGIYSSKAMLGVGWAYAARENYTDALRFWSELRKRDPLDLAVQEGLLASGFAYNKLHSNPLALMHYRQAVTTYKELQDTLDSGLAGLRGGETLSWLPVSMDDKELSVELTKLNENAEKRTILRVLDIPAVREEYRQYRDFVALTNALQTWSDKYTLYDTVLDERVKRQRERALTVRQRVKNVRPEWLEQRFNVAQRTLITSDMAQDGLAFARDTEVRQLQRLQAIYDRLARVPADGLPPYALERYAVLRGILLWNIYTEADNRRKDLGVQLAAVEKELLVTKELWRRMELLSNVDQIPVAKLKKRVSQIRERLKAAAARATAAKLALGSRFTRQITAELEGERQHVAAYLAQAQYAVARLFDESMASGEAQ